MKRGLALLAWIAFLPAAVLAAHVVLFPQFFASYAYVKIADKTICGISLSNGVFEYSVAPVPPDQIQLYNKPGDKVWWIQYAVRSWSAVEYSGGWQSRYSWFSHGEMYFGPELPIARYGRVPAWFISLALGLPSSMMIVWRRRGERRAGIEGTAGVEGTGRSKKGAGVKGT